MISYEFSSGIRKLDRFSSLGHFVTKKFEYFGLLVGIICILCRFISAGQTSEYKEKNMIIFKKNENETFNNKYRLIDIKEIYNDYKKNKCKDKTYYTNHPEGSGHENIKIDLMKKCKTDKDYFLGILRSDLEDENKEINFVKLFDTEVLK